MPLSLGRHTARTLAALLLATAIMVLGFAPTAADASTSPRSYEQDLLALVNVERAKAGLGALTERTDIRSVARNHSDLMARQGRLHHNPDFSTEITNWQRLSENVGVGPSVATIHRALMNSESHRRNILDSAVTELGIGVTVRNDRLWITQNFRRPQGSVSTNPPSSSVFGDVSATSVHASSIEQVARVGIADACGTSRFCPWTPVTRAEFSSMLVRALDLDRPSSTTSRFQDVSGDAARDAEALAAAGLTNGCAADRFCPNQRLSREQLATFFARALELAPARSPFSDVGTTHGGSVGALYDRGIVNGCTTSRFCPADDVQRAQTASMLARNLG